MWQKIKKKKIYIVLLIIMHLLPLGLISHISKFRTLMSLKEITPGTLYTMNYYENYKFDKYLKIGNETFEQLFKFIKDNSLYSSTLSPVNDSNWACSAFSTYNDNNEPIYGRNLDIPGNHPAVLLYTKPKNGYKSMSMVELTSLGYSNNTKELSDTLSTYKGRKALLAAPYMPRDGMNEYGLVVATLNAPSQNIKKDPKKVSIGRWQVLRLLLDNAKTIDEAINLFNNYNSFDGEVHFFIADASGKSVVLEYSDKDIEIIHKKNDWQIVTNFLLSHPIEPGGGHDRYITANNLLKNFNGKVSEYDAMRILKYLSQPSTTWSVVYNQKQKSIDIAMDKKFYEIKNFKLK